MDPQAEDLGRGPVVLTIVAFVVLDLVLSAPVATMHGGARSLTLMGDLVVLVTVASFGGRRGAGIAAMGFMAAWAYQCVRLGSVMAMGQEGLLFDLIYLAGHTKILAQDLLGAWVVPAAAASLVFLAGLGLLVWRLFLQIQSTGRHPSFPVALAVLWLLALAGTVWSAAPVGWIAPAFAGNLTASMAMWGEAEAKIAIARDNQPPPAAPDGPDVHLYAIESYGALLLRNPDLARQFRPHLRQMRETLVAAGWSSVSGLSLAPVSGGRSWIADASVMIGVPLAHESTYRHVIQEVDRLPHLPGWIASQGWHTVLCRPKDRSRPGVELENHFGFQTTVFFDDLGYEGAHYGWGWIPDQYTLGWLRDEVLPQTPDQPVFLFAHLASSHVPWWDPPPVRRDWRAFNRDTTFEDPNPLDERTVDEEIGFTVNRFRRGQRGLGPTLRRHMHKGDPTVRYLVMVAYDIEMLTQHMLALDRDRPQLVIIYGDHQPPGIAPRKDFAVPVHVFATDPGLLAPWREAGFVGGVWPDLRDEVAGHESMYGLIAASLR